jgi:hypothetical protein
MSLAALLVVGPAVAAAHHTYAMFDQTRTVSLRGTIRALEWSNPHIWVWVDATDPSGKAVTYGFESNAPSELARFFGWSRQALKPGEPVSVEYSPLKSGRPGGALRTITFTDGRVLKTPRSDPNYRTGPSREVK